jgi:hypothetical protein
MSDQNDAGFRRPETHKIGLSVVSAFVFLVVAGAGAATAAFY